MAYELIGEPIRYSADIRRGVTWSILPTYTTEGYLLYTGVKEGYFTVSILA